MEIQGEQSSDEYGGPQATNCMDTNLDLDRGCPSAFNHAPCLLISICFMFL
jgi:hypothetical protein